MRVDDVPFIIRPAASGDEHQLALLNREFNNTSPVPEQIRSSLQSLPAVTLVAERMGAIQGFVVFHVMRSFCYASPWIELTELYVGPSHRRQGIGLALCRAVMDKAQELGAAQVWLRTGSGNEQAQRVYRRAGFELTSEVVCRRFLTADIP